MTCSEESRPSLDPRGLDRYPRSAMTTSPVGDGHKSRLDVWNEWLDALFPHIANLHADREDRNKLVAMVEANREIPDPWNFINWVDHLWVTSTSLGIRRLAECDKGSISLGRVIDDVGKHREMVSRAHFLSLYAETYPGDAHMRRKAGEEYDQLVGPSLDMPSEEMTTKDRKALEAGVQAIRHYVNKHVAHLDDSLALPAATYADIDAAIEGVSLIYNRYCLLIRAEASPKMPPKMSYDWERPFLVAWKPDDRKLKLLQKRGKVPREEPPPKSD